jgi:hypothetical protein
MVAYLVEFILKKKHTWGKHTVLGKGGGGLSHDQNQKDRPPVFNFDPATPLVFGTILVLGHTKSVQAIYDQIPGSQPNSDGSTWSGMSTSFLTVRSTNLCWESSLQL